MDNRVKRILVLGGGTAGWMTACFLNRSLRSADGQTVEITLVESRDIGIIGVGEATLANIKRMMTAMDVNEFDFMRCCDASFKNAIRFEGFCRKDEPFWHPFTQLTHVNRYSMANLWLGAHREGFQQSYAEAVTPDPVMCDRFRAPRTAEHEPYHGLLNYAYHIDTVKLGRYLRDLAKSRGVHHVIDTVVDVAQDENGNVVNVTTKEHGDLAADFFIDCTGFLGLLINKTLGEPFESYNDVLFNDRAVAMRVPYAEGDTNIPPFTGCYAQDAGWIWKIPLFGRLGTGHVYASDFMSPEDAEQRLRDFIGPQAEGCEANHIRMRIGRTRNAWSKNVCSVGLSGGFIEPLESTGIYLAELGLTLLAEHFPTKDNMATMSRAYNRHMASLYEEIRDFICMHYCLTEREDTDYWRACRNHPAVPESLQERLALWSERLPIENDLGYTTDVPAFSAVSYIYICFGMNHAPKSGFSSDAQYDRRFAEAVFADRHRSTQQVLQTAPDHRALLSRIHGAEGAQWAEAAARQMAGG